MKYGKKPKKQERKSEIKQILFYLLFLVIVVCIISGCAWTNNLLYSGGLQGNKDTLPVLPIELVEMANYCNQSYSRATTENKLYEIAGASDNKDEFSYHV